ncbi:hypothetical protein [Microbacterium sp. NPDC089695]|uniref:hypothetical protein n=1 Tax=Microbacterium sp. NPDC089695 TaxID=3364198 RepID=UPI0037F34CE1
MRHADLHELDDLLFDRSRLERDGWTSRSIRGAVEEGRLHRVRRGWFMRREEWDDLWPESRHRAEVLATAGSTTTARPVFSHVSAAVLWNLPLHRVRPQRVHVMAERAHHRHSVPGILRHEGALPAADIDEIAGIRVTSLSRTVYDVARTLNPEAALAIADAAIAHVAGDPWAFDALAADVLLRALARRARTTGARGIRQAREIVSLADGRAQLPLESVTRYRLHQLGFARPLVQVPVAAPGGGVFWMDLGLEAARTFIECDGLSKYLDPSLRGARTTEQVLLDEKAREDWVRGTTGWRVVRIDSADMRSVDSADARFRAFGLRPTR